MDHKRVYECFKDFQIFFCIPYEEVLLDLIKIYHMQQEYFETDES